jgi:hypothetical protein
VSYWRNIETDPPPPATLVLLSFDHNQVKAGYQTAGGEWYGNDELYDDEEPVWWAPMPADTAPAPPQRYCLVGDGDGHEYTCPVEREAELRELLESEQGEPDWAERVEGGFTFTDPRT